MSRILGYGIYHCPKKCYPICKPKFCTHRVCKQYQCGYRAVCHKVTRYRIVKKTYKVKVVGLYYPARYVIKYRTFKVPYSVNVCKNIPKYCTRCWLHKYGCGYQCRKVCKQVKVRLFISDFICNKYKWIIYMTKSLQLIVNCAECN